MSTQPSTGHTPGVGAGLGAAAFLLTYAVVYALTAGTVQNSLAGRLVEALTGEPGTWKLVGGVFFNAHFTDTLVLGLFGTGAVNLIDRVEAFSPALYALPSGVLLAAGLAAGRPSGNDPASGAAAGAALVTGYLPLAVAGAVLFRVSAGDATAGPDLPAVVLVAGLVYPALLGAAGGALVARG